MYVPRCSMRTSTDCGAQRICDTTHYWPGLRKPQAHRPRVSTAAAVGRKFSRSTVLAYREHATAWQPLSRHMPRFQHAPTAWFDLAFKSCCKILFVHAFEVVAEWLLCFACFTNQVVSKQICSLPLSLTLRGAYSYQPELLPHASAELV